MFWVEFNESIKHEMYLKTLFLEQKQHFNLKDYKYIGSNSDFYFNLINATALLNGILMLI